MTLHELAPGAVYVFPDEGRHFTPDRALAGPFPDGDQARRWIVAQGEAKLTPELRAHYDQLKARAGGDAADVGQLLAFLMLVARRRAAGDPVLAERDVPEPIFPRRLTAVV